MATKFYLTAGAAPYTPATIRGAWNASGSAVTRRLSSSKAGGEANTTIAVAETNATDPYSVLLYRGVSGPLAAQTLSGTLDVLLSVIENSAAANMCYHLYAYITTGDSDTVRGTIVSDYLESTANEWGTEVATSGRALSAAQAISLAISDGDRLVLEIGYTARNSVTNSYTGTLRYGSESPNDLSALSDLTAGGDGTLGAGFISFSVDVAEYIDNIAIRNSQVLGKAIHASSPTSEIRVSQAVGKAMVDNYQVAYIRKSQVIAKILRSPEPPDPPVTESRLHNPMIGCWI